MKDEHCSSFTPKRPHFFKIILEDSIEDKNLLIPKRFVRKNGKSLTNPVCLKVPTGEEWQIGLLRCDGEVRLQNGWQKFADYYSLEYGDFLMFQYEGNSQFSVVICDKSATEIDYHQFKDPKMEETQEEDEDDLSVVFLGEEESAVSRLTKMMKTGSARKIKRTAKPQAQVQLERATGFRSKYPFFLIAIKPSCIGRSSILNIPQRFMEKYLKESNPRDIILNVSDGRSTTWDAKICYEVRKSNTRARITAGWAAFARQINLKVGDACALELINHEKFRVSVYRA